MRVRPDMVFSVLLTLAAVGMTSAVVHKEFFSGGPINIGPTGPQTPTLVESWSTLSAAGVPFGPASSQVVVTVFSDFECPFCRAFHQTLQQVRKDRPDLVRVSFVHHPLSYHRFARPAAKAAECAAEQGRFEQFADIVFARQDSLGLLSWAHLATRAGVENIGEFDACVLSPATFSRIDDGIAAGKQLRVQGTPTVLINGWRLPSAPDNVQLVKIIEAIERGDSPTDAIDS